jgi:hypothetical protein
MAQADISREEGWGEIALENPRSSLGPPLMST